MTDEISLRATHDDMLARLSKRRSIVHFAHAAVAIFVACVMSGASWRLSVDVEYSWAGDLVIPAMAVAVGALVYGVARLGLGQRVLNAEVRDFEALRALRKRLRLDEPRVAGGQA